MDKTALISVSDKTGLLEFAQALSAAGVKILSTGGTLKFLLQNRVSAEAISDYTGFPEIMDGRVKTLHPKVHGGILAVRDNPKHVELRDQYGIRFIDIVVVNLYPFRETVAREGVTHAEAIENIDIGGPCMLRASAKNHKFVTSICDPDDYATVARQITEEGEVHPDLRLVLAKKAFAHTAAYDAAIVEYLTAEAAPQGKPEKQLRLEFTRGRALRYGENNHQTAEFYREASVGGEANIGSARQLHGKELSFNNLVDADAALEAVREICDVPGVAIIKHTNPCGYATGSTLAKALEAAWDGDPVSAFGSVIAFSREVDLATAEALKGRFVEVLIAPGYTTEALDYLRHKSKDLRLLDLDAVTPGQPRKVYKHILGGMLVQDRDVQLLEKWESPTRAQLPETKKELAMFTWKACKHVKSNAITIGHEYEPGQFQILGIGPGQPNRIDSNLRLCQPRVRDNAKRLAEAQGVEVEAFTRKVFSECVLASDAFFPFDDNVIAAHDAGIRYIVQPGGSVKDADVIATADRLKVALVFTGTRHFRH